MLFIVLYAQEFFSAMFFVRKKKKLKKNIQ